ncbi:MAG: phosphoribosylamine--glycine ligase [Saprospiraceae bacterium]|jgi:phosphoribosylamine--glycine ligase
MNILILGSGGREHTFAWKIRQSPACDQLFVAPGNAGTAELATNLDIDIMDFNKVEKVIKKHKINMVIVGPEAPLVAGITDFLKEEVPGLQVIGPSKKGAQLEGSKAFAKEFMVENDIPTAAYVEITESNLQEGIDHINSSEGPYVLKADGLAGGKGVLIINDKEEAIKELEEMLEGKFGDASTRVVIEQFLSGLEFSVFVLTDGQYYILLPEAKDYKRIGAGDTGLNTGGMGAISPVSFVDSDMMHKVRERIILPTLSGLQKREIDYVGFIFFGLIEVNGEPFVIEYNCRMGDPETEVVFPRIKNDIVDMFEALHENDLYEIRLDTDERSAATIMMVSGGYPESYEKGKPISIDPDINNSIIFHSGTINDGSTVRTNGGRVIAITSLATTKDEAVARSLTNAKKVKFENSYYRSDIGFDLD